MKKAPSEFVQQLLNDKDFMRSIIKQQREDLEFYRGKVERLELALMSNPPAQEQYAQIEVVQKPPIKEVKVQQPPRIPFSDLKQKWMAMSAEEQEKAMEAGWEVDKPKEEVHEG